MAAIAEIWVGGRGAVRHLVVDYFVGCSKNIPYLGDGASYAWNGLRKCSVARKLFLIRKCFIGCSERKG